MITNELSAAPADQLDFMLGGGEVGTIMRKHDWSRSPLGHPSTWPQSLRAIVALMISSRHPMFVAWGAELAFLYNDGYAPILGARHPDAVGRRFQDIWSEIWPDIWPLIERALSGEATWSEDLHLVMQRNGYPEDTWYTFSYSPVRDESGAIAGMFCACTETTQTVLNARALVESEARFRNMADHAPVMVWVTDADGACTYLSRSWYEFTGQTPEEALGMGWLEATHPDDRASSEEIFLKANRERTPFRIEYRLRRRDGSYCWAIDAAQPRLSETGQFLGYIGSVIDITDRKRAEQQREQLVEHQKLLINELNHRVKNTLATVQALASQSFRTSEDLPARAAFESRLIALSKAHDVLTRENWAAADIWAIVNEALAPHRREGGPFALSGPSVRVGPRLALSLSLILHELVTNATKYGALKSKTGEVSVKWRVADGRTLELEWREAGGPPVQPPTQKGFGSRLIERQISREFGGETRLEFHTAGVSCCIRAPLEDPDAEPQWR